MLLEAPIVETSLPADSKFNYPEQKNILAIYHLQGQVTAGFENGFNELNMPRYAGDLAKYPDTGGQTAHVFEKLWASAKNGTPSILFAMSNDFQHPDEIKVVRHNLASLDQGDAFVVYLPFNLFTQGGVTEKEWIKYGQTETDPNPKFAMVPKEVTMKHREALYPLIAKASIDFMRENIQGFNEKNIILDGNYVDGAQTIIHAQEILKEDDAFKGATATVVTPHTLGIEKCKSMSEAFIKFMDNALDASGLDSGKISALKEQPYLEKQRNVQKMAARYEDSANVAGAIAEVLETRETDFASFQQKLAEARLDPQITAVILKEAALHDLAARNEEFSFIDRLTMESGENLSRVGAIKSVGEESVEPLRKWTNDRIPVEFVRNGFDSNVYRPDALENVTEEVIVTSAQTLLGEAHPFVPGAALLRTIEAKIEDLNLVGDEQAAKTGLLNHPYLRGEREVVEVIRRGDSKESIAELVKAEQRDRKEDFASFQQHMTWASTYIGDMNDIKSSALALEETIDGIQSKIDRQAEQLREGTTFIAISRPDARKGSDLSINAFAQWALEHPDEKGSLILGAHKPEKGKASDYQQTLLNLVEALDMEHPELHLGERIFLMPSLRSDQVRALYALPKAVGLSPSLNEPWGLVGVEQAGTGIPILASDKYQSTNFMQAHMQQQGVSILPFASGNVEDFAAKMGEVTKNYATYKKHAIANAGDVGEAFQWEAMYRDSYQPTYDTLIANNIVEFQRSQKPDAHVGNGGSLGGKVVSDYPSQQRDI